MNYTHTPGPWQVNSGMVETATGIPIAWMDRKPNNGTMPVERDQNAKLVAAAPELLEALKAMLKAYAPKADFSKPDELHSAVLASIKVITKVYRP